MGKIPTWYVKKIITRSPSKMYYTMDQKNKLPDNDESYTPLQYSIRTYSADFTLQVLRDKMHDKEITIPSFQRKNVWTITQASRLIESFMMGLPIPQIYLHLEKNEKLLVIDGKQRLETIYGFFENRFGEKTFKLKDINKNSPYFGKSFSEFSLESQRKLKRLVLRAIITEQISPSNDNTSIYHIFERLNTGGTELKEQEIRNCVYHGKLNDLLNKLNEDKYWRLIYGVDKHNRNKKDVLYILRYMALYHDGDKYKKPMKEFLSTFMSKHRGATDNFLNDEKTRFEKTCEMMIKHLGKQPLYKPRRTLNPSSFDAIFIAFAKNFNSIPDDIEKRFKLLLNDEKFQDYITNATTDSKIIPLRLKLAEEILFG